MIAAAGAPGAAAGAFRYSAFISYSRMDRETAVRLHQSLEGYVLPAALRAAGRGLQRPARPLKPIFRDEDELVPGQNLPERIARALAQSEYLIVICSPNACASEWVEKEILDFCRLGRVANILAVVAAGEPNAAAEGHDAALEALPRALRFHVDPGGRITSRRAEPLWVDWRDAARRDRMAFLRMVAALLSLDSLDDLIRRDARRRRVRRGLAFGAAAAVCLAAGILAALYVRPVRATLAARSAQLAEIAHDASDRYDYDGAARFALAALAGHDDPVFGFPAAAAEAELARARFASPARLRLAPGADFAGPSVYSPDGAEIAAPLADGTIAIWNARTGSERLRLQTGGVMTEVAFGLGGARLAATSMNRDLVVWDAAGGGEILRRQGDLPAGLSADGKRIVAHGEDGAVRVFDAADAALLGVLGGRPGPFAASRDAERVLTFDPGRTLRVRNVKDGAEIFSLPLDTDFPTAAFSPDGRRIVLLDGRVKLIDAATGAVTAGPPLDHPYGISFSPDSRVAVIGGTDAAVVDLASGRQIATFPEGPAPPAFTADGTVAMLDNGNGVVSLVDTASGEEFQRLDAGQLSAMDVNRPATQLFTATYVGLVTVWNTAYEPVVYLQPQPHLLGATWNPAGDEILTTSTGAPATLWATTPRHRTASAALPAGVNALAFSPDGAQVAAALQDGSVHLLDPADGHDELTFSEASPAIAAAFDPAGARLVIGAEDGTVRIRDAADGRILAEMRHGGPVTRAAFAPDGARVATASYDGTAVLWDAASGAKQFSLVHGGEVYGVAFSPDGRTIATASADKQARLWDAATGAEVARFPHDAEVWSVAFSPDGRRLLTASRDRFLRVWTLEGEIVLKIDVDFDPRMAVYLPSGRTLLSASTDHYAHLWDGETGREVARLRHGALVEGVAASPDGRRMASGDEEGVVQLWDVADAELRGSALAAAVCGDMLAHGFSVMTAPERMAIPTIDVAAEFEDGDVCRPR